MKRILVVDDDELMRDSLTQTLSNEGYAVSTATSGKDGLHHLVKAPYNLIITDLKMPEVGGIELLEEVRRKGDATPVILITAYGTIPTAVSAMKEGASDYIVKPFQRDTLLRAVEKALRQKTPDQEASPGLCEEEGGLPEREIIGESDAFTKAVILLKKYAPSTWTVLLRGESGTGKEVFAQLLHRASPRNGKPFLSVNCAALSAGLLESELFGHEKGAFTGAERQNIGRFEIADGGTILLDEVSEIDLDLQAKLLRVLQEKEFQRVGNARTIRVDVRVVATSNRNLEKEVEKGRFREDLYYRLNQLVVEIPPLRKRREDIPLLAGYFLSRAIKQNGGVEKRLTDAAVKDLMCYAWPGNVRELQNSIERAYLLCEEKEIAPHYFQVGFKRCAAMSTRSFDGSTFIGMPAEEVEKAHVLATLRHMDWHQQKTADLLGIGVRTLRDKIKRWDLKKERC